MKPLGLLVSFFARTCEGLLSKLIALKVDVTQNWQIYCLQARPCIFQPGNVTGWGSEGVNLLGIG